MKQSCCIAHLSACVYYTTHSSYWEPLWEARVCGKHGWGPAAGLCVYVLKGVSVISWLTAHETEKLRTPGVTAEGAEQQLYVYIIRVVESPCKKYDVWGCFFPATAGSTAFVTSMESRDSCCVWCGIACFSLDLIPCSFLSLWVPKADKNTPVLKNFTPILQPFASFCLFFFATTGYKISYRVDSRDPQRWTTVEVGSNGRQFTVTGLSAEQTYVFRLIARTAVGWGEQLEALVVTTERRGQSNVTSYLSLSCKCFTTISHLFSSGVISSDPDFVFLHQYIHQGSFTMMLFVRGKFLASQTENCSSKIKCQCRDEFAAWITSTFTSSHWHLSPPHHLLQISLTAHLNISNKTWKSLL